MTCKICDELVKRMEVEVGRQEEFYKTVCEFERHKRKVHSLCL